MRLNRIALALLAIPTVLASQGRGGPPMITIPAIQEPATPESARRLLSILAADSMEGRLIWSRGGDRAAKWIAEHMRSLGLVPAGDSGYFQRVPGAVQANGRVMRLPRWSDLDTVPADRRRVAVNVVGILPRKGGLTNGDSVVLVGAHYDHIGMVGQGPCQPAGADSICNGADDDASGVIAMLEMARIMKKWPAPSRTVVFAAFTGEESGFVGTRYYIDHPARPIAATAADLQIEMIGRPDTMAIGPGRAWLTGYERTTMGETFQRHGLQIVPDPRPSQSFFTRSDNYDFAIAGIPAHTLSSFNGHGDYHRATDEVSKVDFDHMSKMINVGAKAMWVLTEGPAPAWLTGQRPCPRVPGAGGGRGAGQPQLTPAQQDSARLARQYPQSCASR